MPHRLAVFLLMLLAAARGANTPRALADVPIQTADQKKINLKQYRGNVVLLVLFSTTCDDCVRTLNLMNSIQKDYGARGLQVVAAAVNSSAAYLITSFVERYRPIYPTGYLDEAATMKIAGFTKDTHPFVPIVMFIDRKGIVQREYFGNDPIFKQQDKAFPAMANSLVSFGQ